MGHVTNILKGEAKVNMKNISGNLGIFTKHFIAKLVQEKLEIQFETRQKYKTLFETSIKTCKLRTLPGFTDNDRIMKIY